MIRISGPLHRITLVLHLQASETAERGTARLIEAVSAYQSALEIWTREEVPLDWAMAQNNLGSALKDLGERREAQRG